MVPPLPSGNKIDHDILNYSLVDTCLRIRVPHIYTYYNLKIYTYIQCICATTCHISLENPILSVLQWVRTHFRTQKSLAGTIPPTPQNSISISICWHLLGKNLASPSKFPSKMCCQMVPGWILSQFHPIPGKILLKLIILFSFCFCLLNGSLSKIIMEILANLQMPKPN